MNLLTTLRFVVVQQIFIRPSDQFSILLEQEQGILQSLREDLRYNLATRHRGCGCRHVIRRPRKGAPSLSLVMKTCAQETGIVVTLGRRKFLDCRFLQLFRFQEPQFGHWSEGAHQAQELTLKTKINDR
jgi:hypothetical protein